MGKKKSCLNNYILPAIVTRSSTSTHPSPFTSQRPPGEVSPKWLATICMCELLNPKGLERLSTFPEGNWCHSANGNRKGIIAVGSALRKPSFRGQPVIPENNLQELKTIHDARGTIHLRPRRAQGSLPLDPNV